jgi:polyhydroxyalkanoate synthesis regulator phasin
MSVQRSSSYGGWQASSGSEASARSSASEPSRTATRIRSAARFPGRRAPGKGSSKVSKARDAFKASKARGAAASNDESGVEARASMPQNGLESLAEEVAEGVVKPLDLVILTRRRIQEALDEAAERGRVTRTDADELVAELVKRGRQHTQELLAEIERLIGHRLERIDAAATGAGSSESTDPPVRTAGRAPRTVGAGPTFPIHSYDDLSAAAVEVRLEDLTPAELRNVREYERRHANRKSVLDAIETALG